tara:strand:+ start:897 stop:1151 length:255 start_codon:yes stop_codon:yes gene_type:complete
MHKVTVLDSLYATMFVSYLTDDQAIALSRENKLPAHIKKCDKVAPGTGNAGNDLEFQAEYDGYQTYWSDFRKLMNSIDIYEDCK